jgi:hypothetical protein
MSDMNRVCQSCGESFYQYRGRPAKRCKPCRGGDRYGPAHRAFRAGTVDQAVGKPCAPCQLSMLEGQPVQLDHADDGSGCYIGYSHRSCNARAGAINGNRARAAAYRAARGLPGPAIASPNGAGRAQLPPAAEPPNCIRAREEISASDEPLACICGRPASRCW